MDLSQPKQVVQQELATNQRLLDECKERKRESQEVTGNLLAENMQTRHRQFLDEIELKKTVLVHNNNLKRSTEALLSTQQALQRLKDFDEAEKQKIEAYDEEIKQLVADLEQPNVAAESAELDKEIESLSKEVEESKADLAKLKMQKELARERLERTKKNGNKQQARLMQKRCELQMKLFNLNLNKK